MRLCVVGRTTANGISGASARPPVCSNISCAQTWLGSGQGELAFVNASQQQTVVVRPTMGPAD